MRRPGLGRILLFCLAVLGAGAALGNGPVLLDFDPARVEAGKAAALKEAGWVPNPAADNDKDFQIALLKAGPVLQLWDNSPQTTPAAEYAFSPTQAGALHFMMGTAGVENQAALLLLQSGDTVLASVGLSNNTAGQAAHGGGTSPIRLDKDGTFYLTPRAFTLLWRDANGRAPGRMTLLVDGRIICREVAFKSARIPDTIKLVVGWGSAENRGLLLGPMRLLTPCEEPVSMDFSAAGLPHGKTDTLKIMGWRPNAAAESDRALYVAPYGRQGEAGLFLWDLDRNATPAAEYVFGTLRGGELTAALGVAGDPDQDGALVLKSGGAELLRLTLQNNTTAVVSHGKGDFRLTVADDKGWYLAPQDFSISWLCDPQTFRGVADVRKGEETLCAAVPFKAVGQPDSVEITVSSEAGEKKALILRRLTILPP